MRDPVLHLVVGPNGAGKSTLYDTVIGPVTHLEYVNADLIAAERWPADASGRSYEAAVVAAARRAELLEERSSFATETVFSHASKLELVRAATTTGYLVSLHVVLVPEKLAIARVTSRVAHGGHGVPEAKIRGRYHRLWPLVAEAIGVVENATVYDNSRAKPAFRVLARFESGALVGAADWPAWTARVLREAGR